MKQTLIAGIMAVGINASASDFPKLDLLHAHCEMQTQITGTCDEVWKTIDNTLKTMADPAQGTYRFKEDATNSYTWATRTTPVSKKVDDVIFTVAPTRFEDADGCVVNAKSRSQALSIYDYETNFCNMYNVFRSDGRAFTEPTTSNCKFVPERDLWDVRCSQY